LDSFIKLSHLQVGISLPSKSFAQLYIVIVPFFRLGNSSVTLINALLIVFLLKVDSSFVGIVGEFIWVQGNGLIIQAQSHIKLFVLIGSIPLGLLFFSFLLSLEDSLFFCRKTSFFLFFLLFVFFFFLLLLVFFMVMDLFFLLFLLLHPFFSELIQIDPTDHSKHIHHPGVRLN